MTSSAKLKLDRNTRIMVGLPDEGPGLRYSGIVVGNFKKEFLILGGFKEGKFELGDDLIVRTLVGNEVMGFQTTVDQIIEAPRRMYITPFPDEISTINLRKTDRITVFVPADVQTGLGGDPDAGTHFIKARMLNISEGGCYFSSKSTIDSSSNVKLSFSLPGDTMAFSLAGEVLESARQDTSYSQRVLFAKNNENMNGLSEISQWISRNLDFAVS